MKSMKRVLALVLAMVMCLGLATVAMATEATPAAGSITIKNAAIGKTYTLYKVFDATYDAVNNTTAYTVVKDSDIAKAVEASGFFTLGKADSSNKQAVIKNASATDTQITDWIKGLVTNGTIKSVEGPITADSTTLTFTTTAYGYYYISTDHGATVTIDNNTPNATLIDKNRTTPTQVGNGKEIIELNGVELETPATSMTAQVGDTVKFKISFSAVNFITPENATKDTPIPQVTKYTVTDTSYALNIDWNSVVITVGSETLRKLDSATTAEKGYVLSDSTIGQDGKTVQVITLPWVNGENNSLYADPSQVTITYTATVTSDAADAPAENKAIVQYNDVEPPVIDIPTDEIKTYKVQLIKTNGTAELTGAEFKLYDSMEGGNEVKVVKEAENVYRVAAADETGAVIEAGNVTIKGLKGDTSYYLEETKAPDGYNKLDERTEIQMANKDRVDGANPDGTPATQDAIRVVNKQGSTLPSTGGIGTTIFYVIGGLLVIGAGVLLVTKKRMSHNG